MNPSPSRRSTIRRAAWSWALPFCLIVVALLAIAGVVFRTDLLRETAKPAQAAQREGYVAVPIARVSIPAYTQVTRDHLFDAAKSRFATVDVSEGTVRRGGVMSRVEEVIGRVVARDKPAGYVFQERDFLPIGTRPGLAGGIPAGMRGMRIDASRLAGCFGLQRGDRLDLVATYELDDRALKRASRGAGTVSALSADPRLGARPIASVRVVAHGSVLVQPVTTRAVASTTSSLTQGSVTRARPVQELVVAIAPAEVPQVSEALAVGASLSCVPRSGQPEEADSPTPDRDPFSAMGGYPGRAGTKTVELIDGAERRIEFVPDGTESAR